MERGRKARLASQLPLDSRTKTKYSPANAWTKQEHLLLAMTNSLNFIAWTKTKQASRKGAKAPEPFDPPELKKARRKLERLKRQAVDETVSMPIDQMKAFLKRPRV